MKSLYLIFKKKKKPKLSDWEKRVAEAQKQEYVTPQDIEVSVKKALTLGWLKIPKRFIHTRWFLPLKRRIAGVLAITYFVLGIISIPNPISLLLVFTSYLLLDYIYKTRLIRIWRDKDKPSSD